MSEQVTGSGSGAGRRGKKRPPARTTGTGRTQGASRTTTGRTAGASTGAASSGGSGGGSGSGGSAAAKLFDLRVMIGALFTFYGVVLMVAGFLASAAQKKKAAGININLWQGVGMLILGLLFLLWWKARPLVVDPDPDQDGAPPPEPRH